MVSSGYLFFAKIKVRFPTKLCTAAYPGYFLELGTELGFFMVWNFEPDLDLAFTPDSK